MKKIWAILLCVVAWLISGCTTDMRKISVEPKISTENLRKSSLRTGLVLAPQFTNYKHSFKTGVRVFMFSSVQGEMEIGKNLSLAQCKNNRRAQKGSGQLCPPFFLGTFYLGRRMGII